MSINLTDEIEVKTKKGKLGAAKQIFLEGDMQTVEKEIQDINSRHNSLNTKHESLSRTVQGIAVTGGASTANNVTYTNDNSGLNAENAQDAIDEVSSMVIYDVSARNGRVVFESLSALLSSPNLSTLIPISVRHGGMSIRFIQSSAQSSDNKYVQYRLMNQNWSTIVTDWQGVDDKPTSGSKNLVESGSVWNAAKEIDGLENLFDASIKGYIATNVGVGNTVDINTVLQEGTYYYTIISCKKDEVFIIKGKGGFTPRLWCFTDDNYNVVSVTEQNRDTSENPEEIVVPSDGYLIINSNYNQTVIRRYRYVEKKRIQRCKRKSRSYK